MHSDVGRGPGARRRPASCTLRRAPPVDGWPAPPLLIILSNRSAAQSAPGSIRPFHRYLAPRYPTLPTLVGVLLPDEQSVHIALTCCRLLLSDRIFLIGLDESAIASRTQPHYFVRVVVQSPAYFPYWHKHIPDSLNILYKILDISVKMRQSLLRGNRRRFSKHEKAPFRMHN